LYGEDVDDDIGTKTGFFAGVGTTRELNEQFSISPYLILVQKGAESSDGESQLSMNYLEVPILLQTGIPIGEDGMGLGLSAGPAFGYQLSCDIDDNDCEGDGTFDKSFEVGFAVGASLGIPAGENGQFSVGGGVDLGLTSLHSDGDESAKNRGFYLFVGYGTAVGG
jgi:hypothetical protein